MLVPSLICIEPPVDALLPTIKSSIALLESTISAELAVKVPALWSIRSLNALPPISLTEEPSPIYNLLSPLV